MRPDDTIMVNTQATLEHQNRQQNNGRFQYTTANTKKTKKATLELNYDLDQMDLIALYKTFHPIGESTFL